MKRRYHIIDVNTMQPSGKMIMLDLDDPLIVARTIFADDLQNMGAARRVDFGAGVDLATREAESAGEFATGERPRARAQKFPAKYGAKISEPVWGGAPALTYEHPPRRPGEGVATR